MKDPKQPTFKQIQDEIDKLSNIDLPAEDVARYTLKVDQELRRGLLAINGASLVALVGLMSTKLPAENVYLGGWRFFFGLMFALSGWLFGELSAVGYSTASRAGVRLLGWVEVPAESGKEWGRTERRDWEMLKGADRMVQVFGVIYVLSALASTFFFVWGCLTILWALPPH